jgi:flotillin
MADREKDVQIAETHRDRDVKIAITNKDREVSIAAALRMKVGKAEAEILVLKHQETNAIAIKGENEARIAIAQSEAIVVSVEASLRTALASEKSTRLVH